MKIKNLILSLFATLFCSTSCSAQGSSCDVLSQEEFANFIKEDNIILLDVRTPEEFSNGHLNGALNINYNSPDFVELVLNKVDTTHPLAIYCRSGARSDHAAAKLVKSGFKVYQLKDGISKWSGATTK